MEEIKIQRFPREEEKALYRAIRAVNLQQIEIIFQRNRVPPQRILDKCLVKACKTNSLEIVNYFIEAGADLEEVNDAAFFNAFCTGNINIINRLLEIYTPTTAQLNNFLENIVSNGQECRNRPDMVRKLIQEGADENYLNGAPIFAACHNNNTELVDVLLDLGANPNIERDGENCLNYAVENMNLSMIRRLFQANVTILPSINLGDVFAIANANPNMYNFLEILAVLIELIQYGVKPDIDDFRIVFTQYRNREITMAQCAQLLALFLGERISLPERIIEQIRNIQQNIPVGTDIQINLQNIIPLVEDEEKYALQVQQEAEDAYESDYNSDHEEEQNSERNTAENRARALQIEAENEAKRQAALEEYKTTDMEAQPAEVKVNANCYPASHTTIMGDALKDIDDFVVFLIERSEKGDCYLRSELEEIYARPMAYEFRGAPYGVSVSQNMRNMPRGPDENKPVFKLPWTNIWVTKGTIVEAINTYNNLLILKGKRQSIGSDYGNSMDGQFGGHWREENGRAIYVESGDAQPDERPMVYTLMRGVYSQL